MPDQELSCEVCGEAFAYSSAEQVADEQAGYPPPRACPACLQQRRAARAAKREAKRPRRRRVRR
jgi:hypothetical protein